jgi:hypothetical protein
VKPGAFGRYGSSAGFNLYSPAVARNLNLLGCNLVQNTSMQFPIHPLLYGFSSLL